MQFFPSRILTESDIVRLYEWAERSPSAVLKCTCRQVRRMKALSSAAHAIGGREMFQHHEQPGLIAEICGMVVAVTPKEDQVIYEVDDGTSVLRVLETRTSLQQTGRRTLQLGPSNMVRCGIPACYVLPPPSIASGSAKFPVGAHFNVADVVKCTGRIQVDRSGDRFLVVQHIVLCEDVSLECLHQIDVINSENDIYRKPFDWSRIDSIKTTPSIDQTCRKASASTTARRPRFALPLNDKAKSAPAVDIDETQPDFKGRERLSRDEARRLLSGEHSLLPRSLSQPMAVSQTKSTRISERAHPSRASTRQLRTHDKIADRKVSESYFQLQLQQHISLQYRHRAFQISDLSADASIFSLALRLVRLRLQRRQISQSADISHRIIKDSSEQEAQKVRRLFEWAVRKMMQDGFITLGEADHPKPLSDLPKRSPGCVEWYRLVTPEYLLKPLRMLLGSRSCSSSESDDIDVLTARLRCLDDRFRFVNRTLVQDSLALCRANREPIVIE